VKSLLRALPDLVRLITRLATDPVLPRPAKIALAAAALYLLSPIDLIPDFVPFVGYLDDALLAAVVLDGLLNWVDRALVLRYWPGSPESLDKVARRAPAGDLGAAPTQGAHLRAALIPSTSCARSDVRPAEVRSRREPDQRALARIVRHLGDAPASVGIRRRLSLLETLVRERHAEVPRVEASGHVTHGLAVLGFRVGLDDDAQIPAPDGCQGLEGILPLLE